MKRNRCYTIIEWALCVVLSSSCAFVSGGGFYVAWPVQSDPLLLVALPALLLAALFVARRGGIATVVGIAVACAVAAAVTAWAVSVSGAAESPLSDEEANVTLFVLNVIAVSLLVFLLSRTAAGMVCLGVAVAFEIVAVEFLFRHGYLVPSVVAVASYLALAVFIRWRIIQNRVSASPVAGVALPARNAAASCAVAVVVVGLGLAAAWGVVQAINPGTATVYLFTEERALEEVEVDSITDVEQVIDPNLESSETEDEDDSNKAGDIDSSPGETQLATPEAPTSLSEFVTAAFSMDTARSDFNPISHERFIAWVLVVVLVIVLLIVGLWVGRRIARKRWLQSCRLLPAGQQVIALYRKLEQRLAVVGLPRAPAQTCAEYVASRKDEMASFFKPVEGDAADAVVDIARSFEDARYGGQDPDPSVLDKAAALYAGFPKAARAHLGTRRYLRRFFSL